MQWKSVGIATLTTPILVPEIANELLIIPNTQRITSDGGVLTDLLPPTIVITDTLTKIPQQYVSTAYIDVLNTYIYVVFRVTNTYISIVNAKTVNGTEYSNTKLTVLYK